LAAKRILWGKVVNAGQTCVAPDYILVPRDIQDTFVQALKEVYEEFYPDGSAASEAYSRLVTPQAYGRVAGLLEKSKGKIVFGGEVDKSTKFIAPTVVKDVGPDDSLMSE
jgi:aldehyde dehydrogenase (NAD+)